MTVEEGGRLTSPLTVNDPAVDFLAELLNNEDFLYSEDLLEGEEDEDALPWIIGLSGPAGSGKDTIADWLVQNRGYTRLAFADALREAALALNPWIPVTGSANPDGTYFEGEAVDLRSLVEHYGWDYSKRTYPIVRNLLQVLGTEVGRKYAGEEVWVNYAFEQVQAHKRYVITDVRFPNEAEAIKDWDTNSLLIKVMRPGVGPVNGHISDAGLPKETFDFGIYNGSTIAKLHDALNILWPDPLSEEPPGVIPVIDMSDVPDIEEAA